MQKIVAFNRRRLAGLAGGALAAGGALPTLGLAQDDEAATETPIATPIVEDAGVQVTTEDQDKLNVTWWTHNNPAFVAANTAAIEAFEAENPDIRIVYQHYPYSEFMEKLQAGYSSGEVADIQQVFGTWVPTYVQHGLLDAMPEEYAGGMANRFWPAAVGAYERNGNYYGMPNHYSLEYGGLLVNPALLEAAGVTESPADWQTLVDVASATAIWDGDVLAQVGLGIMDPYAITFNFLAMILQQGATYFQEDGNRFDLQSDAAIQAWTDLTDLLTKHRVDDSQSYSEPLQDVFFQGKAAMASQGPLAIAYGEQQYPDLDYRYDPMPPYAGTQRTFAAESGWGEVVSAAANDDARAAAWRFIDFLHQDDQMRTWNLASGTVPSLQSLHNDPTMLEAAPYLATSFAVLPQGQWIGNIGDRDRFFNTIYDAAGAVGQAMQRAAQSLEAAENLLNSLG